CYIENGVIRYANFINGSMHFITEHNLINKILSGDIKLTILSIPQTYKNQALKIEEISKYLSYIFSNKVPCTPKN
ncbi:transposase, partial [Acinetobacter sp. ABJ_C5_2]